MKTWRGTVAAVMALTAAVAVYAESKPVTGQAVKAAPKASAPGTSAIDNVQTRDDSVQQRGPAATPAPGASGVAKDWDKPGDKVPSGAPDAAKDWDKPGDKVPTGPQGGDDGNPPVGFLPAPGGGNDSSPPVGFLPAPGGGNDTNGKKDWDKPGDKVPNGPQGGDDGNPPVGFLPAPGGGNDSNPPVGFLPPPGGGNDADGKKPGDKVPGGPQGGEDGNPPVGFLPTPSGGSDGSDAGSGEGKAPPPKDPNSDDSGGSGSSGSGGGASGDDDGSDDSGSGGKPEDDGGGKGTARGGDTGTEGNDGGPKVPGQSTGAQAPRLGSQPTVRGTRPPVGGTPGGDPADATATPSDSGNDGNTGGLTNLPKVNEQVKMKLQTLLDKVSRPPTDGLSQQSIKP